MAGLVYFLYRKFFKYRIEEKINQKESLFKGLEEQGHALEGRVGFLQQQFQWQEERGNSIKSKIDEWHAAVVAANKRRTQELAQFAQRTADRVEIKNATIAQDHLRHAVMPNALARAQKELEREYADLNRNQQYLSAQVERMGHEK